MRYAKLLSWTLFVVFFLVYLTAIKLVRGNQLQHQYVQHHQFISNQPVQAFQPFFGQQTYQSAPNSKQARDLSDYVTFADQQQTYQQVSPDAISQAQQQVQSSATQAGQVGQLQLISRRQHLSHPAQTSNLHALHPFISPTSNSISSGKFIHQHYHSPNLRKSAFLT